MAVMRMQQERRMEGLKARPGLSGQRERVVRPMDGRKASPLTWGVPASNLCMFNLPKSPKG